MFNRLQTQERIIKSRKINKGQSPVKPRNKKRVSTLTFNGTREGNLKEVHSPFKTGNTYVNKF